MEVLTPKPIPVLKQTVCLVWQELELALYFDTKQCQVIKGEVCKIKHCCESRDWVFEARARVVWLLEKVGDGI